MITLPLNATQDRVAGGLDFEMSVRTGCQAFQPGLLAAAHRGILYVDEVNLLDDHLVDIILDAAASGTNRVQREGIAFAHPSRFVLVGTMNPEEGELRPQLLDRFGLSVTVSGEADPRTRMALMHRREAFDADPAEFSRSWSEADRETSAQILSARQQLSGVRVTEHDRNRISELCRQGRVAGHRADIVMERTACALAAWHNRSQVTEAILDEAASYVLPHRRRTIEQPPPPDAPQQARNDQPPETDDAKQPEQSPDAGSAGQAHSGPPDSPPTSEALPSAGQSVEERIFSIGQTFAVKRLQSPKDRLARRGTGRRSRSWTARKSGRYVRSQPDDNSSDLALDATLRAAAPYQQRRRNEFGPAVCIRPIDVRRKVRERRIGNFIVFVVDASGSMGAAKRMMATKGAIMSLLLDAYRMRDRFAMVTFRKNVAKLVLPPTNSIAMAARLLEDLPTGGRTPLSAGMIKGYETTRNRLLKDPNARPIMMLITDGKSNVTAGNTVDALAETRNIALKMAQDERMTYVVVDCETNGPMAFGLAGQLAQALGARYMKIDNLQADDLVRAVKDCQNA
jgi:magnesium chelatase subunit D